MTLGGRPADIELCVRFPIGIVGSQFPVERLNLFIEPNDSFHEVWVVRCNLILNGFQLTGKIVNALNDFFEFVGRQSATALSDLDKLN
jgi:hypothetical protein